MLLKSFPVSKEFVQLTTKDLKMWNKQHVDNKTKENNTDSM